MGYPESSFLRPQHPSSSIADAQASTASAVEASAKSADRIQTRLTAAVFLGVAVGTWFAGLHIAPTACVIFAVALLVADAQAGIGD